MIGKGIFHTNIAVRDVSKSMRFYQGLFGMERWDFVDGDLVFLTTPGRGDVLTLTPAGGTYGFPGGCAKAQYDMRPALSSITADNPTRQGPRGRPDRRPICTEACNL